jgi:hypothetical protein
MHLMKANHLIRIFNKWFMQFYQPSHQFMYTVPKFLITLLLNTLNICPTLNTRNQDCNIRKRQVKHSLITLFAYSKDKRYISHWLIHINYI